MKPKFSFFCSEQIKNCAHCIKRLIDGSLRHGRTTSAKLNNQNACSVTLERAVTLVGLCMQPLSRPCVIRAAKNDELQHHISEYFHCSQENTHRKSRSKKRLQ